MSHRPRWCFLPLLGALVATSARPADGQSISFGLMAGISQSKLTGNAINDISNAGFIAGGYVRLGALGFAVQPGLYYTAKGAKTSDFSETTNTGYKTNLDYIQIPIVIRIHMGPLYIGGGPAIGLRLKCTTQAGSEHGSDCDSALGAKNTEISGIAEAGIEIGKFSLGARADIGISNAIEAIQTGNTTNLDYKTQTVSIVAAIRF